MCFYDLEDFRKAERGELHKDCLKHYLEKTRELIDSAAKDDKYVNRVAMEPYREHGFNALQNFAKETLKMLMLANGGGAVAILTLGGKLTEEIGTENLPQFLYGPLKFLLAGMVCVVFATIFAILSQRHFNKPIPVKNYTENIIKVSYKLYLAKKWQVASKILAALSAICLILGVIVGLVNS